MEFTNGLALFVFILPGLTVGWENGLEIIPYYRLM